MQDVNYLSELFLSTEIYGYFGPFILVAIGYVLATNRKYRTLALLWLIVEFLFVAYYFSLIEAGSGFYWWHIIILLFGGIFGCLIPASTSRF